MDTPSHFRPPCRYQGVVVGIAAIGRNVEDVVVLVWPIVLQYQLELTLACYPRGCLVGFEVGSASFEVKEWVDRHQMVDPMQCALITAAQFLFQSIFEMNWTTARTGARLAHPKATVHRECVHASPGGRLQCPARVSLCKCGGDTSKADRSLPC